MGMRKSLPDGPFGTPAGEMATTKETVSPLKSKKKPKGNRLLQTFALSQFVTPIMSSPISGQTFRFLKREDPPRAQQCQTASARLQEIKICPRRNWFFGQAPA